MDTERFLNKLFHPSNCLSRKSNVKYLRLLENDCHHTRDSINTITEGIMAMGNVPNLDGFTHGSFYKIRSVKDNNVSCEIQYFALLQLLYLSCIVKCLVY
jgi:hypothetical protein